MASVTKFVGTAIGVITTPTSTGSQSLGDSNFAPDIGFTPEFMLIVWTKAQSVDSTLLDTADGEVMAVSLIKAKRQYSTGMNMLHAASTTDTQMFISQRMIDANEGDKSDLFVADFSAFVDGGFTANFTATDGTARKGIYLAIGPEV